MRARDIIPRVKNARLWQARVHVKNPQYTGYLDAQVWAPNPNVARQLLKAQYRLEDWHVGSIQEVK